VINTPEQALDLINALLANARDLIDDSKILRGHDRYARSYALAALAGEELGKLELCLDRLIGDPTITAKGLRRGWQSHTDKLISLAAYRTLFVDDLAELSFDALREQAETIGRTKMDAIYVDFRDGSVSNPTSITASMADDLISSTDAAIRHASANIGPITAQDLPFLNAGLRAALEPLFDQLESLSPEDLIAEIRGFVELVHTRESATDGFEPPAEALESTGSSGITVT